MVLLYRFLLTYVHSVCGYAPHSRPCYLFRISTYGLMYHQSRSSDSDIQEVCKGSGVCMIHSYPSR
jgi:hypothetical protein